MNRKWKRTPVGTVALVGALLAAIGMQQVQAQEIKINTRPLTQGEIEDYGLMNTTQTANGTHVTGLGQPVYLELLVTAGTVVTKATWTLDGVYQSYGTPPAEIDYSKAKITASSLPKSMPTYDSVDRKAYDVVDRAMLVPDVKGTYRISAQAVTSNGTLTASLDVVGSVFLGQNSDSCSLCHYSKQAPFNTSLHSVALKTNINDPNGHFRASCIKCHALGYDSTLGAVNGGFDDIADYLNWSFPPSLGTNNWDNLPEALQMKSNVQCESCHGPAQEHMRSGGDITKIGISLSAGNCGQCHDAPSHHVKNFEWGNSAHGQTEIDRSGECVNCHTTAGFIDANDPSVGEFGETISATNYATFNEGITCVACHDPHAAGAGTHQLRNIESVTLANGTVITNGGDGLVCMACHHARQDAETYVKNSFSSHSGPHHGPQADMLAGKNAIEYGQDMPSSKHLDVVGDSCAQCHMQAAPRDLPVYAENRVGDHTFMLACDDGTNPVVRLTETCANCHGNISTFDFGGEDYDLDGVVEGVQTEIGDMLNQLALMLPPYGSASVAPADCDTLQLRKAAYNYLFVEDDGSKGVHNPQYAAAILRAAIDDLKGGIDVDRDGLVDSWEVASFGDITSQSAKDDFDGDGLTNEQEEHLGTDSTLKDSDGDGVSDLLEFQSGSDPLDRNSVPSNNMVALDAVEVGYLPQATGTTVRIQSTAGLGTNGWQDVAPAQTNGEGWVFELDSMQGTTNRFYRAIEE